MLEAVSRVERLAFPPGTRTDSSNSGYVLLGLIVEAVDGRPLADFLAEEVFGPAGIRAVLDPTPDIPERARSYYNGVNSIPVIEGQWATVGDIGVQTTAGDLAKWGAQYWSPSVGGDDLLAARMQDTVSLSDDPRDTRNRYGAGIAVNRDDAGRTVLQHPGENYGFVSDLVVLPDERLAAAVLCNNLVREPSGIAIELLDAAVEDR